jgi:hypothetical protein
MGLTNQPNPTKGIIIMDKFTSQVQVEETAEFHAWLDAQEVADIHAIEAETVSIHGQHRIAMEAAAEEGYEWEEVESDDGHCELYASELYEAQAEWEAEQYEGEEPEMELPNDLFMIFDDPDYWA